MFGYTPIPLPSKPPAPQKIENKLLCQTTLPLWSVFNLFRPDSPLLAAGLFQAARGRENRDPMATSRQLISTGLHHKITMPIN
jgi:hypothetical protein